MERERRTRKYLNAIQNYYLKIGEETKFVLDNVHAGGVKPNLWVLVRDWDTSTTCKSFLQS